MTICNPCKMIVNTLEWLGLYEPEIGMDEALQRLITVKQTWMSFKGTRGCFPGVFTGPMSPFVSNAVKITKNQKFDQPIAVDLGCGLGSTAYHLCEKGWKVYAVDSSKQVLNAIEDVATKKLKKKWIAEGKLVLVHKKIEDFEYPENVHLITATASLPYCDPTTMMTIFNRAKNALIEKGVFAAEFFSLNTVIPASNVLMQNMFGGWVTTKNVIDAVANFTNFHSVTVQNGRSPSGLCPQIHVIARG